LITDTAVRQFLTHKKGVCNPG